MDDFELFFTGEKAAEILEYFYKDKDKSKIFIWNFKVKDIREWLGTSKKYFIERLLLIEYIKRLTPDDPEELSYSFLESLGRS